ncbi:MAG TPA: hypothetical protein VND87_09605, partial [Stellaceae bacterium]|nr:hypothetical protein [Stellaceae bacterium]
RRLGLSLRQADEQGGSGDQAAQRQRRPRAANLFHVTPSKKVPRSADGSLHPLGAIEKISGTAASLVALTVET